MDHRLWCLVAHEFAPQLVPYVPGYFPTEESLARRRSLHSRVIRSAYYVPDVSGNLLSVSYLIKRGYSVNFSDDECRIFCKQDRELCGIAKEVDGLFIVNAKPIIPEHAYISRTMREISEDSDLDPTSHETALVARTKTSKATLGIWHRRLGHISLDAVKQLLRRNMVTGMDISSDDTSGSTCVPCLEGKQTRDEIPKESSTKHPRILHRIYSDLCGLRQGEVTEVQRRGLRST